MGDPKRRRPIGAKAPIARRRPGCAKRLQRHGRRRLDPLRYQRRSARLGDGKDQEILTVKVRYKLPDGDESRLIARPLLDQDQPARATSESFRFAAAVAEFGLLLRDSEFKGAASYQSVVELAESALGGDPDGRRTEFVYLAKTAARLSDEEALSARR